MAVGRRDARLVIPAKYRAPYGTTRLTKTRCRPVIGTYGMVM